VVVFTAAAVMSVIGAVASWIAGGGTPTDADTAGEALGRE
jgi:hypothetical protein